MFIDHHERTMPVIQIIRSRMAGKPYSPKDLYTVCWRLNENAISDAVREGDEEDAKAALCELVRDFGHDEALCDYIQSVCWARVK